MRYMKYYLSRIIFISLVTTFGGKYINFLNKYHLKYIILAILSLLFYKFVMRRLFKIFRF